MSFEAWVEPRRRAVDTWIEAWIDSVEAPARLQDAMAYSLRAGGKRLRPLLALAAAEACGAAEPDAELRDFAVALELVHTYSLIHDDLPAMDDDDLRRGKPTSHKVFGEAMAILAGDGLLTEAFALLAREASEVRAALCGILARAAGAGGMVGGQVMDVERQAAGGDLEAVEAVHRRKTAALIQAACLGGARAAEGSEASLRALGRFGERVGLAFQIADDLLDVEGAAEALGKAVGKDAGRGVATVPGAIGVEGARARGRALLGEALGALEDLPGSRGALEALARRLVERTR